jgi:tripartite-type tricarboxylate transporter receptor subunit TctC
MRCWRAYRRRRRSSPRANPGRHQRTAHALAQPDVREVIARDGATPAPGTPEAFGKLITFDLARWSKLVKAANIKVDE